MALDDYGALMQNGGNVLPDALTQQMQQSQLFAQNLANQQARQSMAIQQLELRRQQAFGQDMQSFLQQPSAQGLAELVGRYPEFEKQAQDAWSTLDTNERRSTATQLGSLASLVARGDIDDATNLVQSRIEADKAAGRDTSLTQQMLGMLQSGDPAKQKAVIGLATTLAGGAVGFDKAADFLNSMGLSQAPQKLAPGEKLVSPQSGDTLASNAPNLTAITVNNPDGSQTATTFNPQTGQFGAGAAGSGDGSTATGTTSAEGGGPASAGGDGGFQHAVATVLHNEGGWNPKDMNGSPTMMGLNLKSNPPKVLAKYGVTNPKDMTPEQASQIYYDRYWKPSGAANLPSQLQTPYFDVYVRNPALAKRALAQSGGDPQKFMQIAQGYFQNLAKTPNGQKYASAWANRDANNMALATGQASQAAAGNQGGTAAPVSSPYTFSGSRGGLNTKDAQPGYAWNSDHTAQIPVPGSTEDFSPQALDTATMQYALTGQLPGGMGGGGIKSAIIKNLPTFLSAHGLSQTDLPAIQKTYKGLSTSLEQATTTANALNAAQTGLQHDSQLVLSTRAQVEKLAPIPLRDGGVLSSLTNRKTIEVMEDHGTQEQQAAAKSYLDAVNAFARTYGKFMSAANGVGGSGSPSDASQAMANELNDEGMGRSALKAHLATVLKEADNKRTGWESQAQLIQAKIHGLIPGASSSSPVHVSSIQQAQSLPSGTLFVAPNGKTYRKR